MQMTIQLDKKARRPIAEIDWFEGCRALIDTGALFPIWNKSEDQLVKKLGAKLVRKGVTFRGFGGETQGNLYRVDFMLNNLIYREMPIIANRIQGTNWSMLLSATMFDGMINKKLNIDVKDNQPVRLLRLSDDDNGISVYLAGTYKTDDEYLQKNK